MFKYGAAEKAGRRTLRRAAGSAHAHDQDDHRTVGWDSVAKTDLVLRNDHSFATLAYYLEGSKRERRSSGFIDRNVAGAQVPPL